MQEPPLKCTVPLDINACDSVGGLIGLQEFILNFLTYYFVIIALLTLSYLPPGAMWSYEMLFVIIVFLIGIFIFIPNLGIIRKLVRGKIMEMDGAINNCIKVEEEKVQKLLSDSMTAEAANEVTRIQTLLEIFKGQHNHLQELYNNNPSYNIRTIFQSFASLLLPVLAFFIEVTSQITSLMTTIQGWLPPPP